MLKSGKYRHFKGNFYEVIDIARHSETEEEMVIYKCERDGSLWVRPLAMFTELVEVNGVKRPRFEFIGE